MSRVSFQSVKRVFSEQTLSTAYGAAIEIPVGAINASVTLSDSAIAFVVQDQATGTPEEAVGAGGSWLLGNDVYPLGEAVSIKIKSASGNPVATASWFEYSQAGLS